MCLCVFVCARALCVCVRQFMPAYIFAFFMHVNMYTCMVCTNTDTTDLTSGNPKLQDTLILHLIILERGKEGCGSGGGGTESEHQAGQK